MDVEPGSGWADAVSKILHTGKKEILGGAIKAKLSDDEDEDVTSTVSESRLRTKVDPLKKCSMADPIENELKSIATAGIIQLFNVFKTVNKKSDKKKKKKKKTKKLKFRKRSTRR